MSGARMCVCESHTGAAGGHSWRGGPLAPSPSACPALVTMPMCPQAAIALPLSSPVQYLAVQARSVVLSAGQALPKGGSGGLLGLDILAERQPMPRGAFLLCPFPGVP